MRAFLTRLYERWKAKADRSAAGTPVPAGLDPHERRGPTAHERSLIRRRLRRVSGGTAELDAEAQALRQALDERMTLDELLASGAVVRCHQCGELAGRREPTCGSCGAQLSSPERHTAVLERNGHTAAPTTAVTGASSARSPTPPAR